MPEKVRNIRDAADLRLRYREVFNKYVGPAKCLKDEPNTNGEYPKQARFNCDYDKNGARVDYMLELTTTG